MPILLRTLVFLTAFCGAAAVAQDAGFGSVKKIDLSDDKPAQAPGSNHTVIMLNLKKAAPGHLGQAVIYQFSKRARIDFEADGLPKGEYILAAAPKCVAGAYGKGWTELHRFNSTSAHIQNEKSLPNAALRDGKPGTLILMGKALGLFRVKPAQLIDCKIIEQSQ
jgi:hypothetical protein